MSDEMVANWSVLLVVLSALLLVRKYRAGIQAESCEGYRNITGGLVILAFVGLARVYHGLGLFETVPFFSISVFFDLAYWIGVITGSSFVVNGAANWIPQVRNQNQRKLERLGPLLVLKQVQQLVGVESRPDKLMAGAVAMIRRLTNAEAGAAVCYSDSAPVPRLVATDGRAPFDPSAFEEIKPISMAAPADRPVVNRPPLPPGTERPDLNLPLFANRELFGWLLFWGARSTPLASDDLQTVRLAADAVARAIEQRNTQAQHEIETGWSFDLESLTQRVTAAGGSSDRFAIFCRGMANRLAFDWAALSIWEQGSDYGTRISVNRSGRSLVEQHHRLPRIEQITGQAYYGGPAVIVSNLTDQTRPGYEEILSDGDIQSLAAWPIGMFGEYRAVLTLASAGSELADENQTPQTLRRLSGLLREVVWPSIWQRLGTVNQTVRPVEANQAEINEPRIAVDVHNRAGSLLVADSEYYIG